MRCKKDVRHPLQSVPTQTRKHEHGISRRAGQKDSAVLVPAKD